MDPYGSGMLAGIPDLTMCGGGDAAGLGLLTNSQEGLREVAANLEDKNGLDQWPWPTEQPAMSQMSVIKAERARHNRAYLRELLRQRQPVVKVDS
jgi:hypothetical protein